MVCFTIQVILGSFPRGGMSGALKLNRALHIGLSFVSFQRLRRIFGSRRFSRRTDLRRGRRQEAPFICGAGPSCFRREDCTLARSRISPSISEVVTASVLMASIVS